jgi:hypothetical protein
MPSTNLDRQPRGDPASRPPDMAARLKRHANCQFERVGIAAPVVGSGRHAE